MRGDLKHTHNLFILRSPEEQISIHKGLNLATEAWDAYTAYIIIAVLILLDVCKSALGKLELRSETQITI